MPELPEVETVRRGLAPWLEGARITNATLMRPDLRFPFPTGFSRALAGQTVTGVGRRAKYLLFGLSGGATWLSHLGMTGVFTVGGERLAETSRIDPVPAADRHVHMRLSLEHPRHGALTLAYADPRRFGFMDLFGPGAHNRFIDPLGPEALGNMFNALHLTDRLRGRRGPIKSALLDQRIVAGLGNIYVCEALHGAGIAPTRAAGSLSPAENEALVRAIVDVLEAAIAAGGSTLSDFRDAGGKPGYFQHSFSVYGREDETCRRSGCTGTIARLVQSGRSSFFCPVCQR
ncbi:bifunctional DNA-formamidopyrimidine glycosylase/DNA-(apurinic or apyrimidinic site) lyase [Pelagibacterium montanilacus]|uniref:bifunctional DNA-formamidopyrimidine glycosylase/DNA-(apurinic or apyrimidinic site) lyase n=1 Tax=Pelagibacterium montanilacus TaxID=2185280 RepID=UPI000F8CE41F|nr:bifunctional DNA-formamidopyrimidine glycosylase/DNA-(apurinic or apyrimidinic site) lyase [Pelagibacterium montanilacus]